MKILTNMAHLQHRLRQYLATPILQVWRIKMKPLSSYFVNDLIWHYYAINSLSPSDAYMRQ